MQTEKTIYWAIIPAAGSGTRMQTDLPKQYLKLNNKTVLEHSLQPFLEHETIYKVIVVLNANDHFWSTLKIMNHPKIITVPGAERRCDSVLNALRFLRNQAQANDWVLVHDAVRPCLQREDIDKLIQKLTNHPLGGLLVTPVRDTLKRSDSSGNVLQTVNRENLWHALTPQMFRYEKLLNALEEAVANDETPTDDAAVMELAGEKPLMVEGNRNNIKITYAEDLTLAKKILQIQQPVSDVIYE